MAQKGKQEQELEKKNTELTADLQRIQADFMNYRRRVEEGRQQDIEAGKAATVLKLLPVIDDIERAVMHMPSELTKDKWALGVASLPKNLDKSLQDLGVTRIQAAPGTPFDPTLHEAVMMEDGDGEQEIISEELRAGYKLGDAVIRHSMVKVKR